MQIHSLHSVTGRTAAVVLLGEWLQAFVVAAGFVGRFVALTVLACLFVSAPISFREVIHANHRSSTGR